MLRKNAIKSILGLSVAASLFAVGTVQAQVTSTQRPAATGATASGGTALTKSDQKMLMNLAQANMAEIEAARLAHGKSANDEVRQFAQQMIDDHTKVLDEIKQLAQARGVMLPSELDRSHKATANKLAALSGAAFDRAYLAKAGVSDHKKAHDMLHQAESRAKDPDLKALIARTMPVVDQHLSKVEQLNKDTMRGSSKTQGTTSASPDKK